MIQPILTAIPSSNLDDFLPIFTKITNDMVDYAEIVCEEKTSKQTILSMILTTLSYNPPIMTDCAVEVRDSKYGLGVFATRDIKKGEIPTLYPVHHYKSAGNDIVTNYFQKPISHNPHYCLNHQETNALYTGDPEMMDNLFLGHFLNDFCPFVQDFQNKKKNIGETVMKYYMYGVTMENCRFEMTSSPWIGIRVTKDIKKGEELLIGYSPSFWSFSSAEELEEEHKKYIEDVAKTEPETAKFMYDKFLEYIGE